MPSQADALRARVKRFAVRIVRFVGALPKDTATDVISRQLARSGTGVSSNYHAAGRARSRAEFIAKMGIVAEEADETEHWLTVMIEARLATGDELKWLASESRELRAIFVQAVKTARSRANRS
jgi:four helix bundle protein